MSDTYFFGYGSLVNRRTHAHDPAHPARLTGWRRAWRATDARAAAFLTVVPDEDAQIDGLIAAVGAGGWAALDTREAAYARHSAAHQVQHGANAADIVVYAIAPERMVPMTGDHPILLSYLDVVVQGFLTEFGPEGVDHFFATTDGWEAPVLNDRATPRYPRAQRLTQGEQDHVDRWLAQLNCRIQSP